jgi:hypothetical protein
LFVAAAHQLLGEVLLRRDQPASAEIEFRGALEIDTALAGAGNWRTARANAGLGWVLISQGKLAEGEPLLVAAQRTLLASLGSQHPETRLATTRLAGYYHTHHRDDDAARLAATDKQ